jgi:hypothetical protein
MSAESSEREFAIWAESLRTEYDAFLRQSWAAMQAARLGHWIEDTEEHVRQAGEAFRQKALEKLLQIQVDAGQGSFSPSGSGLGQQGSATGDPSDGGGARGGPAPGMAPARRRRGGAGG